MAYTGKIYRGIDYSPTWPTWSQGGPTAQTFDSDTANDAFASLWAGAAVTAPAGDPSAPVSNSVYRNDLHTIVKDGFDLVRLYDWQMAAAARARPAPRSITSTS